MLPPNQITSRQQEKNSNETSLEQIGAVLSICDCCVFDFICENVTRKWIEESEPMRVWVIIWLYAQHFRRLFSSKINLFIFGACTINKCRQGIKSKFRALHSPHDSMTRSMRCRSGINSNSWTFGWLQIFFPQINSGYILSHPHVHTDIVGTAIPMPRRNPMNS